jgi:hypothetical protein
MVLLCALPCNASPIDGSPKAMRPTMAQSSIHKIKKHKGSSSQCAGKRDEMYSLAGAYDENNPEAAAMIRQNADNDYCACASGSAKGCY